MPNRWSASYDAISGSERSEADRRMAKYKEERRKQLAAHVASRLSSAASSSDEDNQSDKVSYTEYRRRRRKKENHSKLDNKASSVSTNGLLQRQKLKSSESLSRIRHSPEHIYQSISSELGVIPCEKGGVNSGINDTNDSGRSLSPSSRRFISREGSVESSGKLCLMNLISHDIRESQSRKVWLKACRCQNLIPQEETKMGANRKVNILIWV